MTLYLQAFLDPKRFAAAGVLSEESVRTMFQPSFSNAPGFGTIHHGLFQFPFPGSQLAIGHDGSTRYQHAIMLIVPSMDLGIFAGVNTDAGLRLIERLPYLIGMYLQGLPQRPENHSLPSNQAPLDVGGTYRSLRRAYYRSERALLGLSTTSVEQTADGELLVSGLMPALTRFVRGDDGNYHEVDGPSQIAFRQEQGHLLLLDPTGSEPLERIGFFSAVPWLLMIVVLTFLTALWGSARGLRDLLTRAPLAWWGIVPFLWLSALIIAAIGIAPWVADTDTLAIKYPGTLFPVDREGPPSAGCSRCSRCWCTCRAPARFSIGEFLDSLAGKRATFTDSHERRICARPGGAPYGIVAVFKDLYGNQWDLLQPKRRGIEVSAPANWTRQSAL
jgi:hypothetical protein